MALRMEKAGLPVATVESAELDAKREAIVRLEAEVAMPVVAQVVEQVAKTVSSAAGSVSLKDDRKDWVLGTWNKKDKLYGNDPALVGVDKDWLLQHCILDVPRINASFKSGQKLPGAFGVVSVFGGSVVRKA